MRVLGTLLGFVTTISTFALVGCKSESPKTPAAHSQQQVKEPVVEKAEPTPPDYSWAKGYVVNCRSIYDCPMSVAMVLLKSDDYRTSAANYCLGTLIDKDTVLVNGTCIPQKVATGEVSCDGQVQVIFPGKELRKDFDRRIKLVKSENVPCAAITRYRETLFSKNENSTDYSVSAGYALIKLKSSVDREPLVRDNEFPASGDEYLVPELSKDNNYRPNQGKYYFLNQTKCVPLQRKGVATSNFLALDCDADPGAPILSFPDGDYTPSRIYGFTESFTISQRDLGNPILALLGRSASSALTVFKFALGVSVKCLGVDCKTSEVYKDIATGEADPTRFANWQNEAKSTIKFWTERNQLAKNFEWQILDSELFQGKTAEELGYVMLEMPGFNDERITAYTSKQEYLKSASLVAVPSCIRTREARTLTKDLFYEDTRTGRLTDQEFMSLFGSSMGRVAEIDGLSDLYKWKGQFEMPYGVYRHYKGVGDTASVMSGPHMFLEIERSYKPNTYDISVASYGRNRFFIVYRIKQCDSKSNRSDD
jgi:hypothetical protein